jgi:nitronate monooxygenase
MRTRLTELLGIDHPIVQSGMGRIAGPDLVAAVSNAGGLGILAGLYVPPDELARQIRRVRELTSRPFGVNLWLHPAVLAPPTGVDDGQLHEVQAALDRFRAPLGLQASAARPAPLPADMVPGQLEVLLDERVAVWSIGLGNPTPEQTRRCRERDIKVMAMVTTAADARAVVDHGADIVVAQGGEAGGHRSSWTPGAPDVGTMALVPQVVDAVKVPVVAAGGIADGRGLAAALALGAAGVLLGTRFVATREATVPSAYRDAILERSGEETVITRAITGLPARVLRNALTDDYATDAVLPPLLQRRAGEDVHMMAALKNDGRYLPLFAGQSVGLIHDVPGAGDVVRAVVAEAEAALQALR